MLRPTKVNKQIPKRGLKTTHAIAVTKQAIVPPQTTEKIKAATVAAKPKRAPTRGIHFKSVIAGMKRQNQPKMWQTIAIGLTHFASVLTLPSSLAKNSSKVIEPLTQPSTTSSIAKFMILFTQMQMQQSMKLSMQGVSASALVSVP